jgi:hypothetical protein
VHSPLDLLFVLLFFLGLELLLQSHKLLLTVLLSLAEIVAAFTSEPASNTALNVKGGLLSLLKPHNRREVPLWVDEFIITAINKDASLLHLSSMFTHHMCRLGLILVSLDHSLILIGVVVNNLISLRE